MKIGIVTIYDLMNYGNRLQNYATEAIFRKLNHDVETLILREFTDKDILRLILRRKGAGYNWNWKQESSDYVESLSMLWLFEHSSFILTDSFHACVFAFLYNKPFLVYDREGTNKSMNSRLKTLLSTFHIERKYANSGLPNDIWEHDYTEGYKQLEIERKKAFDFLRESLED